MMDENDRSHEDYRSLRHISRKEGSEDTAPIEVDSSAFFSDTEFAGNKVRETLCCF